MTKIFFFYLIFKFHLHQKLLAFKVPGFHPYYPSMSNSEVAPVHIWSNATLSVELNLVAPLLNLTLE